MREAVLGQNPASMLVERGRHPHLAFQKLDAGSLATGIRLKIDRDACEEMTYKCRGLAIQDAQAGRIVDLPKGYIRLLNVKPLCKASSARP